MAKVPDQYPLEKKVSNLGKIAQIVKYITESRCYDLAVKANIMPTEYGGCEVGWCE